VKYAKELTTRRIYLMHLYDQRSIVSLVISNTACFLFNMSSRWIVRGSEAYAKMMKRKTAWMLQDPMEKYIAKARRPNEGRNNEKAVAQGVLLLASRARWSEIEHMLGRWRVRKDI
jgi:hypothetical protein